MVSTDDPEIAALAKQAGASVPFLRSAKNSDDQATTAEVLEEVLQEYKKRGQEYDYLVCLYPTAPLVSSAKLVEAMTQLVDSGADSVLPIIRFSYPIQRSLKIEANGRLVMNWPENMAARSQDLPPAYHDSGQFYCLNVKKFLEQKKLFMAHTKPIIISELEAQDIDNEEDWQLAEMKYQLKYKKPNV